MSSLGPWSWIRLRLRLFLTALMFLSRLPVPAWVGYSPRQLNLSLAFFPQAGYLLGLLPALAWLGLGLVLPAPLALLLALALSWRLAGAFHEDGFADFCDAYGAGGSRERILEIMKDSRLGTYGTLGLMAMQTARFLGLWSLPGALGPLGFVLAQGFSRLCPVLMTACTPYARTRGTSKPVGHLKSPPGLVQAGAWGLLPSALVLDPRIWLVALPVTLVLFLWLRSMVIRRTAGYTGDVLGALQQLTELSLILVLGAFSFRRLPVLAPWTTEWLAGLEALLAGLGA